jgi:hypothetical protein
MRQNGRHVDIRIRNRKVAARIVGADTALRPARVDLSRYAGMTGLKLRFDFSTAGQMRTSQKT